MEIRRITENVVIYSDGQRLQVIHDLGDEFILDLDYGYENAWNIDDRKKEQIPVIQPVFKVCGFCSRSGEDMHRLRWAILQFQEFEQYLNDYQEDLIDWLENLGGEDK